MTQEALKRVAEKLRRAGASIPAPEVTGTIMGSVVTGLCIALALVEGEIEALAQEKALQALHNENERLGLYKDAYAQPEQEALADQEFILHDEENEGGWTDWICPKPDSYLMKCCDCGLVHEMQTRVANYESRPSEDFVVSSDPDLQAQFRVRRHEVLEATPPQRAEHITDGSPCWCEPELDYKDPDTGAEVWIHKEPQ